MKHFFHFIALNYQRTQTLFKEDKNLGKSAMLCYILRKIKPDFFKTIRF